MPPIIYQGRLHAQQGAPCRGFSLLEIVLVLLVLGIMGAALLPSARSIIERGQRDAELRSLDAIEDSIRRSFQSTDLTALNVAALPGTIGPGDSATVFSASTTAPYTTTDANVWFAKVARLQGIAPAVGLPPSATVQPEVARLAFNGSGNPRLLFAGPTEAGQQRFLLVSLVGRPEQLTVPAFEASAAWFDAIWNHDWENRSASLPADWLVRLSAGQAAAWHDGGGGLTQVHRLCVRRIVLPKYRLSLNNNHPTEHAFVSFNHVPSAFTAAANTGASVTPEILGGRLVTINRGTVWPGVEALRFHLHENATVTLQ